MVTIVLESVGRVADAIWSQQDLGAQGGDPLSSGFQPMTNLLMVRAPRTQWVLDKRFSGRPLDCGPPLPLTLDPRFWPESEEYCEIPWGELRARLSGNARTLPTVAVRG